MRIGRQWVKTGDKVRMTIPAPFVSPRSLPHKGGGNNRTPKRLEIEPRQNANRKKLMENFRIAICG